MTTKPGKYTFRYTVSDSTGNTATTTRVITALPDTYTLTFNLNGAPGTPPAPQSLTSTATSKPADPSWEGHVFLGWYTTASGGTEFEFGNKVTANTTIYAHWAQAASKMPETGEVDSASLMGLIAFGLGLAGLSLGFSRRQRN